MNKLLTFIVSLPCLGAFSFVMAGTPSAIQATPVPYSIPIVGQVQLTGSDARAQTFNTTWLPQFQTIINNNLSESVVFSNASGFKLDSSKLFLRMQAVETIRVYFLAEGAGYMNTLGFAFTPAGSSTPGNPTVIFPNASMGGGKRSQGTPLKTGDFVDLGRGGNGWQIDFFLIADAYSRWKQGKRNSSDFLWYWNDISKNHDKLQHVVAFAMPNSPYVLIGFEDLPYGGDKDYNDALFVVDIGYENVTSLTDDPSSLPN